MKKTAFYIALVTFICLLASCSREPQFRTQALPSGRIVKIAGVLKMHFSNQDPALMLKYYTSVDMNDKVALQTEAEDIWQSFKVNVEKTGLKSAILSANELPQGIISKTSGFNFVFKKQDTGEWTLMNDQTRPANNSNSADAKSRAAD